MRPEALDKLDRWILDLTVGQRARLVVIVALVINVVSFAIQLWLPPIDPTVLNDPSFWTVR
jgi:hypothetical protein